VVYTTSNVEEDILHSYNFGASGYIIKPVTYIGLTKAIEGLVEYWVEIVRLPSKDIQNE
jgi:DNA-binding NarL/FixJ family response regulator